MILASELIVITLIILFVPPGTATIILLIALIAMAVYTFCRFKLPKRFSFLASFLTGSLLSILALGVFDIINIVLLASLFVGLTILLK